MRYLLIILVVVGCGVIGSAGGFGNEAAGVGTRWDAGSFVQPLGTAATKSDGTSLTASTGAAITTGNDLFVGAAVDDIATIWTVTDDLGTAYAVVAESVNPSHIRALIFHGVTGGGLLGSITLHSSIPTKARAMVAGEFSGISALTETQAYNGRVSWIRWFYGPVNTGDLLVGVGAFEDTTATNTAANSPMVGRAGTSGQSDASNVEMILAYGTAITSSFLGEIFNGPGSSPRLH